MELNVFFMHKRLSSMPIVLEVLIANLTTRAAALIGAYVLSRSILSRLGGFLPSVACGFLTAVASTHLLPEAFESGADPHELGIVMMATLLIFPLLGFIIGGAHDHHSSRDESEDSSKAGLAGLVAGGLLHSIVDGVLVATAFFIDSRTGWFIALAVLGHELPQQVGYLVVFEKFGFSKAKAMISCSAICLSALVGGVIGSYALSFASAWVPYALAASAMSFLFIALFALLPETIEHAKGRRRKCIQASGLLLGAVMSVLLLGVSHDAEKSVHAASLANPAVQHAEH